MALARKKLRSPGRHGCSRDTASWLLRANSVGKRVGAQFRYDSISHTLLKCLAISIRRHFIAISRLQGSYFQCIAFATLYQMAPMFHLCLCMPRPRLQSLAGPKCNFMHLMPYILRNFTYLLPPSILQDITISIFMVLITRAPLLLSAY